MSIGAGPDLRWPDGLLTVLGGRRGSRAPVATRGARSRLAPLVLLLGVPLVVASLRQAACAATGWQGRAPMWRQCSSPLMDSVAHGGRGGLPVYLEGASGLDLPVVRGVVTTTLASLAPGSGLVQQRGVLVLWALLAALLLAGMVVLVGTTRGAPSADPLALALSPVVALTALLSVDLAAVALAAAALWAWGRRRPELAGVFGALAVLGGRPALVVLLALALSPPAGVRRATRRLLTAAGVTMLLVIGPVAALDLDLLLRPVRAWWTTGAGAGSPWFVPVLARHPLGPGTVGALSLLGLLLTAALMLVLATRRPRPAPADLVLLGLVLLLLTGTSFAPATAIWLVPLVALAGVRWRDHLVWAGAEAVHAVALYAWLDTAADPAKGLPAGWYATALALRMLAVGRLAWVVWARASWEVSSVTGTLRRSPSARPVENSRVVVGDSAYPPVTERP